MAAQLAADVIANGEHLIHVAFSCYAGQHYLQKVSTPAQHQAGAIPWSPTQVLATTIAGGERIYTHLRASLPRPSALLYVVRSL